MVSKFVGPVGKSDISYECPTKNVGVPDQMSDRKKKIMIGRSEIIFFSFTEFNKSPCGLVVIMDRHSCNFCQSEYFFGRPNLFLQKYAEVMNTKSFHFIIFIFNFFLQSFYRFMFVVCC